MATLPALPNEILINIIEHLLPDDIPPFALSCKHMHALSQERLTSYRECKKKFSVVKFHGCPEQDSVSDLPGLLEHMISDQRIAFYPRSMILEVPVCREGCTHNYSRIPENRDNDNSDDEANQIGSIEKLNSMLNIFGSRTTKTKDATTHQRLRAGKDLLYETGQWGPVLGLLLTTFPNIETLKLRYFCGLLRLVQYLLWNAVEKNRGPGHTGPTILTKLKTVVVDIAGFNHHTDAEIFACFALFPSVKRLVGRRVESRLPLGSNVSWTISEYLRLWHPNLAVTEVNLQESRLSYDFFSRLLHGVTRLKRFTYGYLMASWAKSNVIDPYRLIDLLLLHSKSTLEYLELKGFDSEKPATPALGTGYGCLRDFEALKEVRVDAAIWMISKTHRPPLRSELRSIQWEDYIIFPLAPILPSCVETVYLVGPFPLLAVSPLLIELTMAKGQRLRSLKAIVFRGVICPSASMLKWAEGCVERYAKIGIRMGFEWHRKSDFTA